MHNGGTDSKGHPLVKFDLRELRLIYSLIVGTASMSILCGGVLYQNGVAHANMTKDIYRNREKISELHTEQQRHCDILWSWATTGKPPETNP